MLRLYALTLKRPTAINSAAIGQFSGTKTQELVLVKKSCLELLRLASDESKLISVAVVNTFSTLRKVAAFRIAGTSKDYILLTSDSGKLSLLEYVPEKNSFVSVHVEPYGKSGIRRVVPGEYLAVDPKGRAAMIASIERSKLVYVLNRDSQANVTISSPLEAHTPQTLVYNVVGLDVGYENPMFASIEREYDDSDSTAGAAFGTDTDGLRKKLVFYELDLGINHVIRKWATNIDESAMFLGLVPGGSDGPSGVLVGFDGYVSYKHPERVFRSVKIPQSSTTHLPYIVCGVCHKMKGSFFSLVQTQYGDLFKVTFDLDNKALTIQYFDTIPVCTTLSIFKAGYMAAITEAGDDFLYQFMSLGDEEEENPVSFSPRSPDSLENLQLVDNLPSLSPLISSVIKPEDGSIVAAVGGSSLKTLRHGLETTEIVSSDLPAAPLSVWTTKIFSSDKYDRYIVLSFYNQTLVLSIGESVESVSDSGLIPNVQTLAVQQMGRDSLLQVHSKGVFQLIGSDPPTSNEWTPPDGTYITMCSCNRYQVAVALSNNKIVYFELDNNGQLNEYDNHKLVGSGNSPILCLSLGEVPEGKVRCSLLAVGCADSTIRIFSLDIGSTLETLSMQAVSAPPSDVRITGMGPENRDLYLHIGLENGVFIITLIDALTGQLSNTRTRFLGPKPVKITKATVNGQNVIMALTTRTWVGYIGENFNLELAPLSLEKMLTYSWGFSSEDCPEGVVCVTGKVLSIFTVDRLGDKMYQTADALEFTPRRVVLDESLETPVVIETDNRGNGIWSSKLSSTSADAAIKFAPEEAAFSLASCFGGTVVGVSLNQKFVPKKSSSGAYIQLFKNNKPLHKTKVEEVPLAMIEFVPGETDEPRLLVGAGSILRLYANGQKQLLRKGEVDLKHLGITSITSIAYKGNRIVVGDIRRSVVFVTYQPNINMLIPFADDPIPRAVTCLTMLDYMTVVAGDRYGNIFTLRVPESASDIADEEGAVFLRTEPPLLNGCPHKVEQLNHFYVGDSITSLHLASLVPASSSPEVVVFTGLQGTLGCLIPILSRNDFDFYTSLEMALRQQVHSLTGRDHLAYRSYYLPVKHIIDGDLCEQFSGLPISVKESIANEFDRTVTDIDTKLADMRITNVY